MTDLAVPDSTGQTVTVTGPLEHLCPHRDEVDHGTVTVTWTCAQTTLELHALAAYLRSWRNSTMSHEQITDRITHDLEAVAGIFNVTVSTTWSTAGLAVTVE